METNNLFALAAFALLVLIVFYNGLGFKISDNGLIKSLIRTDPDQQVIVDRFSIAIQIPDVEDKYQEGGFHLYFESPDLNIKRLLAYNFDKNSLVKDTFDIHDRTLSYNKFKKMIPQMMIYSNSTNVFNTDKVVIVAFLSNGDYVMGERNLDKTLDHNHKTKPIKFTNMNLQVI